jgi:opacity protein-like surface antigen
LEEHKEVYLRRKTNMKCRVLAGSVFGMLLLFTAGARADEGGKQEASAQGTGFFTQNTTSGNLRQTTSNGGGFLLSYRYHFNRWIGADVSYGRVRESERTATTIPGLTLPSPVGFGPGPRVLTTNVAVQSDVHEATAAFLVTVPTSGRLHPYVLAGSGALAFVPTQNRFGTVVGASDQSRAVFEYGGGADYNFTNHFSFRLEYRGFVYKRPNFGLVILRTNSITNTAQPSAGLVFRF